MRRTVLIGLVTGVALAALAVPANAFDHHFSVITKQTSFHGSRDSFRFTEKLVSPFDRDNRVGRDKVACTQGRDKLKCHASVFLNGELGGFGIMHIKGNIGRHDNTLNVVSGTDGFNGVAGKVTVAGRRGNRLHFDLVR